MTKLEEIIWIACMKADVFESAVNPKNKETIDEAHTAILALVPKKKTSFPYTDTNYVLEEEIKSMGFNAAIDEFIEALGGKE